MARVPVWLEPRQAPAASPAAAPGRAGRGQGRAAGASGHAGGHAPSRRQGWRGDGGPARPHVALSLDGSGPPSGRQIVFYYKNLSKRWPRAAARRRHRTSNFSAAAITAGKSRCRTPPAKAHRSACTQRRRSLAVLPSCPWGLARLRVVARVDGTALEGAAVQRRLGAGRGLHLRARSACTLEGLPPEWSARGCDFHRVELDKDEALAGALLGHHELQHRAVLPDQPYRIQSAIQPQLQQCGHGCMGRERAPWRTPRSCPL